MAESVVSVEQLTKRYGDLVAVDQISFAIRPGEVFGLLGPNGAGKTSTLECLEGLRTPDGGALRILGVDPVRHPRKLRDLIGVQLQSASLPDTIRVDEAMRLFCAYHGVPPRYDLLERMHLGAKAHAQYHELSAGQQRRLALALAVAHDPPVLFLDEPTAGLDVPARVELHALIRELQAGETTIILATHDMAEAEELADRVAILLRGRVAATGSPLELTATGAALTKISVRTQDGCLLDAPVTFTAAQQAATKGEYAIYFSEDTAQTVAAILAYLAAQSDPLVDLRVERPSLEDRFLEIVTEGAAP